MPIGDIDGGIYIEGGVSGNKAEVTSDNRLKVENQQSIVPTGLSALNSKLRYLDMNVANGGVARGTTVTQSTWVTIFNKSGSGYFLFAAINFETENDWLLRIQIDSEEIFTANGIKTSDIVSNTIYNFDSIGKGVGDFSEAVGLFIGDNDRLIYHPPLGLPLYYSSNVTILIKRDSATNRKFNAGLVALTDGF